jgi:hypothetical protein
MAVSKQVSEAYHDVGRRPRALPFGWISDSRPIGLEFERRHHLPLVGFLSSATRIGTGAFTGELITPISTPRHVQILCSSRFSHCKSLSSISFEADSELTRIGSNAFTDSSVKSITIPRHVQILCSSWFHIANHFHRFHLKQIRN